MTTLTLLLWLSWSNVSLLKKTNAETPSRPRYYVVSACSSCNVLEGERGLCTRWVAFSHADVTARGVLTVNRLGQRRRLRLVPSVNFLAGTGCRNVFTMAR